MRCRATGEPVWVRRQREWGKHGQALLWFLWEREGEVRRVGLGWAVLNNFGGLLGERLSLVV